MDNLQLQANRHEDLLKVIENNKELVFSVYEDNDYMGEVALEKNQVENLIEFLDLWINRK